MSELKRSQGIKRKWQQKRKRELKNDYLKED